MKHSFDLDNFESFLSEQADQHRMYASDRVWRNIQENIHGKDKWPALTFASILTLSVMAVVLTITNPDKKLFNAPADYTAISQQAGTQKMLSATVQSEQDKYVGNTSKAFISTTAPKINDNADINNSETTISTEPEHGLNENAYASHTGTEELKSLPLEANDTFNEIAIGAIENENLVTETPNAIKNIFLSAVRLNFSNFSNTNPVNDLTPESLNAKTIIPGTLSENGLNKSQDKIRKPDQQKSFNNKSKWSIQLYGTPSISYRYLLENKNFTSNPGGNNGPLAPYLTNSVNEFVKHSPKIGVEVGGAILYDLAENLRVKTGLQFNYRQFGITAYTKDAQPAILALNRGNSIDSIFRYSSIGSQSGVKQMELSSNFFQLAIPIGFDMKVVDLKTVDFYVSAAGQFTYQIASTNYLLSSDYKSYLKQPNLDRKFNMNTSIEAFASFKAGGITWQAGPQIRYQLLPGNVNAYPIKEHLIDYGFKIGVVKKLK